MKGLLTSPGRRHLTAISQNCSNANNQVFSHFMSQSTWDHRSLVDWIRKSGWRLIGKKGVLVIDSSSLTQFLVMAQIITGYDDLKTHFNSSDDQ